MPLLTVISRKGVQLRDLAEGRAPSEDLAGYRVVRAGDLVVNKLWARFGAYGVSDCDGVISPAYWVLKIDQSRVFPRFLHHVLQAAPFRGEIWRRSKDMPPNGFDLAWSQFRTIKVPVPDLDAQVAAAVFLDRECARIEEVLEELSGLHDVLAAQEQEAVSRTLADLPIAPVRYQLVRIEQGWSPDCEACLADEHEWGVLKVGSVNYGRFRPLEHKRLPDTLSPRPDAEIKLGDLLMSRANTRGLVGSAAVVDNVANRRLMMSDKVYRLVLAPGNSADFVAACLNSREVRDQIEVATAGASSSMQNISQALIRSLRLPQRDSENQEHFAALLRSRREGLRVSEAEILQTQAVLAEYRDSLITEAVTGKLDVSRLSGARMDDALDAVRSSEQPEVLAS